MPRLKSYVEVYRYDTLLEFGKLKSVDNGDGVSRPAVVIDFSLYGARYSIKNQKQLNNEGAAIQYDYCFAIKELNQVTENMHAFIGDTEYVIKEVDYAPDPYQPRSYDLIYLLKGNGVVKTYRGV